MPAKTYLQLVNAVGRRLRLVKPPVGVHPGTEYTTVFQDADSVFIASMVNEAKRMVEAEREWNRLRQRLTFSSVVNQRLYDLGDPAVITSPIPANDRSTIVKGGNGGEQFYDTSDSEFQLRMISREQANQRSEVTPTEATRNYLFSIYQNMNGGLTVEFPYNPIEIRDYAVYMTINQPDLELDTDTLWVAEQPVINAATALGAEERGEELGLIASTWWDLYRNSLSEAIVYDMDDTDLEFYPD